MRLVPLGLLAAVLVGACGSRTGLFESEALSACEFPDEAELLALVNDRSYSSRDFVALCRLTETQASAIVTGRPFGAASELGEIRAIDSTYCADLIACAEEHSRPAPPCTPNSHPDVVLELLIDESGSMNGEKWDALRDSLLALFDDIAADRDASLRVGLVMFDDISSNKAKPAPLTEAGQLEALRDAIDKSAPHGGGTGTRRALNTAYAVVNNETARRVIVLLSDGSPSGGDSEKDDCVSLAAKQNTDNGVQLFAVGIGPFPSDMTSQYDPGFMGRLARAGKTAPAGCEPDSDDESEICHYQVTPGSGNPGKLRESFGAALDAIRQSATTCP